jgi:hypothetical protein
MSQHSPENEVNFFRTTSAATLHALHAQIIDGKTTSSFENAKQNAIHTILYDTYHTDAKETYRTLDQELKNDTDVMCALVYASPCAIYDTLDAKEVHPDVVWTAIKRRPQLLKKLGIAVWHNDEALVTHALLRSTDDGGGSMKIGNRWWSGRGREFYKRVAAIAAEYRFRNETGYNSLCRQAASVIKDDFFDDDDMASVYFHYVVVRMDLNNPRISDERKLRLEKVRATSKERLATIYEKHLSEKLKCDKAVLCTLATNSMIRPSGIDDVSVPEIVWSNKDTMHHVLGNEAPPQGLARHLELFPRLHVDLRSDGPFVANVIDTYFRCDTLKLQIHSILSGICGDVRTEKKDFLKYVVTPLGRRMGSNNSGYVARAEVCASAFDEYSHFFDDLEFTSDCVECLFRKTPRVLAHVMSYHGPMCALFDLASVRTLAKVISGRLYASRLYPSQITKQLLSVVGADIDMETAFAFLAGLLYPENPFVDRMGESIVAVLTRMHETERHLLYTKIEEFGRMDSDDWELFEKLHRYDPFLDHTSIWPDLELVDKLAWMFVNQMHVRLSYEDRARIETYYTSDDTHEWSASNLLITLLSDSMGGQDRQARLAAFMRLGTTKCIENVYIRLLSEHKRLLLNFSMRSLCYAAKTRTSLDVYKKYAPRAERHDPSLVLRLITDNRNGKTEWSSIARGVMHHAPDEVKLNMKIIRAGVSMTGEVPTLANGARVDLPSSTSWDVEKRLRQIAYNNHTPTKRLSDIMYLRSLYHDVLCFDTTDAEREGSVLKRMYPPSLPKSYEQVIPSVHEHSIATTKDPIPHARMMNDWADAICDISRGIDKQTDTPGTLSTFNGGRVTSSITIIKLCEKLNAFLCRPTGPASIVEHLCETEDVTDRDVHAMFLEAQLDVIERTAPKRRKLNPVAPATTRCPVAVLSDSDSDGDDDGYGGRGESRLSSNDGDDSDDDRD